MMPDYPNRYDVQTGPYAHSITQCYTAAELLDALQAAGPRVAVTVVPLCRDCLREARPGSELCTPCLVWQAQQAHQSNNPTHAHGHALHLAY